MNKHKDIKLIIKGVRYFFIGLFLFIVFFKTFEAVPAGQVGVVTRFGRVTGRTLQPGANFIVPFVDGIKIYNTKKVIYETTTANKQKSSQADYKDHPVDTNTKDGQPVNIFYTIRFSVDPTKAGEITQRIGNELALVDKIVKTESRIWARNFPREYSSDELYSGDKVVELQNQLIEKLGPVFVENGLILDDVGIREIEFSGKYIGAIEAKQIEAVNVETEKNRADQEEFRKQAKITAAEAQAEEQRLQRDTITDQLIEKLWIEKWNGQLPTYMGGDTGTLLQLPNN